MQLVANDGTDNFIDVSTIPVLESVFTAMFNNSDSSKRLHQLNNVKNFTPTTADPLVQTWEDGTSTEINPGQISATFIVPETHPMVQYAIESLRCNNPGVYLVDTDNQILGYANPDTIATDGELHPIPVERWGVTPAPFSSATAVANVLVTMYFPINLDLSWLRILETNDHNMSATKNYEAKPAILKEGSAVATETTVDVVVSSPSVGILGNNNPISGLEASDFTVMNLTTSSTVSVLTATETPAGYYVLTFANQTLSDELEISINPTTGYVAEPLTVTIGSVS